MPQPRSTTSNNSKPWCYLWCCCTCDELWQRLSDYHGHEDDDDDDSCASGEAHADGDGDRHGVDVHGCAGHADAQMGGSIMTISLIITMTATKSRATVSCYSTVPVINSKALKFQP